MENIELKGVYDEIYKKGKQYFHEADFEILYSEVYKVIKRDLDNKKILDLGCGDGSFVSNYINLGSPKEVYGIDYSEEGINKAIKNMEDNFVLEDNIFRRNTHFVNMSFDEMKRQINNGMFDKINYFDAITSIGVIEHLDDPELLFDLANSLLVPGGFFVLEHPNFINTRGVIWKTLEVFMGAEMSKTDKHILLPNKMFSLMENNNFECVRVKTFGFEKGMYGSMLDDFHTRLRKALVGKVDNLNEKVVEFFDFLRIVAHKKFFEASPANGSEIIWKMRKKV